MNRGKENCCCEMPMEHEPECKPHPKPGRPTETILNCGTAVGSAPLSCNLGIAVNGNGLYGSQPIVQAAVVLDTSKLIDPSIKIDFSSLISFKTCDENYFLHLGFRLSKICGGCPIPLGTWTFEKSYSEHGGMQNSVSAPPPPSRESAQETDPFCFSWCECEDCPGCCRYIVEIVDQQCYNLEYVVVSNISITAMAVGEKNHY